MECPLLKSRHRIVARRGGKRIREVGNPEPFAAWDKKPSLETNSAARGSPPKRTGGFCVLVRGCNGAGGSSAADSARSIEKLFSIVFSTATGKALDERPRSDSVKAG